MKLKNIKWIWLTGLALLLAAACVLAVYHEAAYVVFRNLTVERFRMDESGDWEGGTEYLNVQYADVSESDCLDLYVPDSEEPVPLFVLIHGGGFIAGDSQSRQSQLMYRYFRDRGYACATINYRLAQEAPFPGAVQDCKAAIRFLRANAEKYGYDASCIAVFGESAGGYLAVMCAVTNDDEFNDLPFIGEEEAGEISAKVDVLVNYYGHLEKNSLEQDLQTLKLPRIVYDIGNYWITDEALQGYENIDSFWLRQNVSQMTPEELAYSDPYTYINKNLNQDSNLDVWIIHGDCDITVPYLQSERLYDRLVELIGAERVSCRLVPDMGHASDPLYSDGELALLEDFLKEKLDR